MVCVAEREYISYTTRTQRRSNNLITSVATHAAMWLSLSYGGPTVIYRITSVVVRCSRSTALYRRYNFSTSFPMKPIKIGDVGFIRDGQFTLLFHAGSPMQAVEPGVNVPRTFRPLIIGETKFRDPRQPITLRVGAVEEYTADLGITTSVPLYVLSLERSSTYLKSMLNTRNLAHI